MSRYNKFKQLENGVKYTIVKMSEFGFPQQIQCRILDVQISPYAQYSESVLIKLKMKGRRKSQFIRLYGTSKCLIYEGWIDVNTNMFVKKEVKEDVVVQKSLQCFDNEYFTNALCSTNKTPIVNV